MSVLAKSEILKRLERGEIFLKGSWRESCLRSAGYDLLVANDYLIDPDGTRYWPDDPDGNLAHTKQFWMNPGEVAFVSTVERLCMPFDLSGNIAQKFSVTRNGMLVLGGLLVDPGYGHELRDDGHWWPRENGQRLHFQLLNVGSERFKIVPGETSLSAIQFLPLDGYVRTSSEPSSAVRVPNSDDLLEDLFANGDGRPLAPLAFFPNVADLRGDVDQAKDRLNKQQIKLDSTKRSTDQLLVFGFFLLVITLFTVACAAIIDAIANGTTSKAVEAVGNAKTETALSHDGLIVGVVVAEAVIIFCLLAVVVTLCARMVWGKGSAIAKGRKQSAG